MTPIKNNLFKIIACIGLGTLAIVLVILVGVKPRSFLAAVFSSGGSGTSDDPYKITTCQELQGIKDDLTANYKLMNDIDCSETSTWNESTSTPGTYLGFEPIGWVDMMHGAYDMFTGTLDGQNHKITGLYINRALGTFSSGLFGGITGEVKNVGLEDVNINGDVGVGGLAAVSLAQVTNCYVKGNVNGYMFVGGLIGDSAGTTTNSYSTANVTAGSDFVGGLIGINIATPFNGQDYVGTIENSYATGNVTGNGTSAGGLVGFNNGGYIANVYSTGNIIGTGMGVYGGLIGNNTGTITNAYSIGSVTGTTIGGLVASNSGTITSSYYDTNTSGQSDTGKGEPKTTGEMKSSSTYVDWNFNTVWSINEGSDYPHLVVDSDVDGIPDAVDNCSLVSNPYEISLSSISPAEAISPLNFYIDQGHQFSSQYIEGVLYQQIFFGDAPLSYQGIQYNAVLPGVSTQSDYWNSTRPEGPTPTNNTYPLTPGSIVYVYLVGIQLGDQTALATIYSNMDETQFVQYADALIVGQFGASYTIDFSTVVFRYGQPDSNGNGIGDACEISISTPTISSIDPTSGTSTNNRAYITTISGSGFVSGAEVKLTKADETDIVATSTTVSETGNTITGGYFDLTNAAVGTWSVVVTNPDTGSTTLADAFTVVQPPSEFAGGTGTLVDPYQISTCVQLQAVTNHLDKNFILTGDVDCSMTSTWNEDGSNPGNYFGFDPIGSSTAQYSIFDFTYQFTGTFNGNNHKITGLYINRPLDAAVGLFATLSGIVENVGLENVNVSGQGAGALMGYNMLGKVYNSYSTGSVSGSQFAGGLIGLAVSYNSILNCHSNANVSSQMAAGGLIGGAEPGIIKKSYATGNVNVNGSGSPFGETLAGGLMALNVGLITDSYATGNVTSNGISAGIAPFGQIVVNSYSTGNISGVSTSSGGLVMQGSISGISPTILSSYYNSETSGQSDIGRGEPKTTVEMKSQSTYSGWDFDSIWKIDEGSNYPKFKWQVDGCVGVLNNPTVSLNSTGEATAIIPLVPSISSDGTIIYLNDSPMNYRGNNYLSGLPAPLGANGVQSVFIDDEVGIGSLNNSFVLSNSKTIYVYLVTSSGGSVLGDGRYTIYSTVSSGELLGQLLSSLLNAPQNTFSIDFSSQVLTVNGSQNCSGSNNNNDNNNNNNNNNNQTTVRHIRRIPPINFNVGGSNESEMPLEQLISEAFNNQGNATTSEEQPATSSEESSKTPEILAPLKVIFTRNLWPGLVGDDVKLLQTYLNNKGFVVSNSGVGSKGSETTYFGEKTKSALKKFQEFHRAEILTPLGLKEGTGLLYEVTRNYINQNY